MNDQNLNQTATTEVVAEEKIVEAKPPKLSKVERKKARVMKKLIAGEINGTKAAQMLKITTRQVRNLKRQYLNEGVFGVIHKNRYHKPYNTFDEDLRKEIAHIYRVEFRGTCFTEFAKIMQERGYNLSRSTFYNILRQQRIRSPKRKKHKRKKAVETTNAKAVKKTKTISTDKE